MSKNTPNRKITYTSENESIKEIQPTMHINKSFSSGTTLYKNGDLYTFEFPFSTKKQQADVVRCIASNIYQECISRAITKFTDSLGISLSSNKFGAVKVLVLDAINTHLSVTIPLLYMRIENYFENKNKLNRDKYIDVNAKHIIEDAYNYMMMDMVLNLHLTDIIHKISLVDERSDDSHFFISAYIGRNACLADRHLLFDDSCDGDIYRSKGTITFSNEDVECPLTRSFLEETIGQNYDISSMTIDKLVIFAILFMNVSTVNIYSSVGEVVYKKVMQFISQYPDQFKEIKVNYIEGSHPEYDE